MRMKSFVWRLVRYLAGLWLLALGVAFSINGRLGVSPVNSLPYILSLIFARPMSWFVVIVFGAFILVEIILLGRKFRWLQLLQIAFSFIFCFFIDATTALLGDFTFAGYFGQWLMLLISILLIALGIALYVGADLIPMPMEGLTLVLAQIQKKWKFHQVKVALDCLIVTAGILLSLLFLDGVEGIREGTVVTAVVVGFVVKGYQSLGRILTVKRKKPD